MFSSRWHTLLVYRLAIKTYDIWGFLTFICFLESNRLINIFYHTLLTYWIGDTTRPNRDFVATCGRSISLQLGHCQRYDTRWSSQRTIGSYQIHNCRFMISHLWYWPRLCPTQMTTREPSSGLSCYFQYHSWCPDQSQNFPTNWQLPSFMSSFERAESRNVMHHTPYIRALTRRWLVDWETFNMRTSTAENMWSCIFTWDTWTGCGLLASWD